MAIDLALFPSATRTRTNPSSTIWALASAAALWNVDGALAGTFVFNNGSDSLEGYQWRTAPGGGVAPDWSNKTITRIQMYFYIKATTTLPQFHMFVVKDLAVSEYREIYAGQFLCPGGNAFTWTKMVDATLTGNLATWQDAFAAWLKASNDAMFSILAFDSIGAPHSIDIDTWQLVVTYDDTLALGADPFMEV